MSCGHIEILYLCFQDSGQNEIQNENSLHYKYLAVFDFLVLLHLMKSSEVMTDFLTAHSVLYTRAHLSLSDHMGRHFSTARLQTDRPKAQITACYSKMMQPVEDNDFFFF